ncbi:hypothetical protein Tco_1546959 [Tanacetum coccineum]
MVLRSSRRDCHGDLSSYELNEAKPKKILKKIIKGRFEEDPEGRDVEIVLEDDAELIIFPYECGGWKKPATWEMCHLILSKWNIDAKDGRCYHRGESSSARDSSHVDGLASWALRRDLEASHAQARVMEARLEEVWLSPRSVGNKMFYLDMVRMGLFQRRSTDDGGFTDSFDKEIEEDSNSDGTDGDLSVVTIMPSKEMSEACMREVIREQVSAFMAEFMANMNHGAGGDEASGAGAGGAGAGGAEVGGAGLATPKITGCTYITFMKCDPQPFKGTKGDVGLCQLFEKLESVFRISDCKKRDKVKFVTATLQGRALKLGGMEELIPWVLKLLMYVEPEQVKVGAVYSWVVKDYTWCFLDLNRGLYGIGMRLSVWLLNHGLAHNDNEVYQKCKNKKHAGDCCKCGKWGKLGHKTAACWSLDRKDVIVLIAMKRPFFSNRFNGNRTKEVLLSFLDGLVITNDALFYVEEDKAPSNKQESRSEGIDDCSVFSFYLQRGGWAAPWSRAGSSHFAPLGLKPWRCYDDGAMVAGYYGGVDGEAVGGERRRVEARVCEDRVDPMMRITFGLGRKKSSGGGGGRNPAGEDDRRWSEGGRRWGKGGEGREYKWVSGKTEKLSGMSFHIELL